MKRTKILPGMLAATMLVAACASDGPDAESPGGTEPTGTDGGLIRSDDPSRSERVALQRFDECDAFLDYVHTEGAERVGAFGFNDAGWYGGPMVDDVMVMEATEATDMAVDEADSQSGGDTSSAPIDASVPAAGEGEESGSGDFSTTNVQVEGVDEPDIIKTDGERILAVSEGVLHFVDVDGSDGNHRGSVSLTEAGPAEGYLFSQEILVEGDRAFVIANAETGYGVVEPGLVDGPAINETVATEVVGEEVVGEDVIDDGDAEAEFVSEAIGFDQAAPIEPFPDPGPFPGPGGYFGQLTVVVEVDLSNPDDLRVVNTLNLEGRYVSARSVGDTARIVVTSPPQDLGFLYPSSESAQDAAIEANRDLVRSTTIDDWVPNYALTDANGAESSGPLVACDSIHAPSEFAGFDMLSVLTLGLDESLAAPSLTTSVMATGDTVYASQDRLYVSTNEWLPPTLDDQQRGVWEETYQTGIHRFSLPADAAAGYEASGTVDGHLLNQFSMNDRDGTFFVATTTGTPWSSAGSQSQIVSMQVNGDRLEQVGIVDGLGKGEQIFSVRYVGNTAYVVTFRQTDPFYVVDITSPSEMVVRGELKIPGVSNYLHPISDSLVLGVGQDATENGGRTGSKVSLFDVSDPGNPVELDVWTLPNASSDVEFDHRAFLWWEATSTAVLPLTSWADQFSGAVVLNVTADGITEQGRITHMDTEVVVESGLTDCEVLDANGLTENDGDIFWMAQEPGSQLQLCGSDDAGGATGHYCDPIPVDEIENWFGYDPFESSTVDLTGVDRVEWCWLDGGVDWRMQIQRTLMIDGSLWSMSPDRLQSNDLTSLERTDIVEL